MPAPSARDPALVAPSPRLDRWRRWTVRLAAAYLAAVTILALVVWFVAVESWPVTLFLFGPRWVVALPLGPLALLAAAARSARSGLILLAAAGVAAGPLLGGRVAVPTPAGGAGGAFALRVMTWNTAGSGAGNPAFQDYVEVVGPDLILLQESPPLEPGDAPPGWAVVDAGPGAVVLSRLPAVAAGRVTEADFGAPGGCARVQVQTPVGPIVVVSVHLPTPRPGIEGVMGRKPGGLAELEELTRVRDRASALVADWVGPPTDGAIVAGDFNTPVESTVYRRNWSGFRNAFSTAGTGWGTTKQTRWFGTRIDHVLYAPPWVCRGVRTGPSLGSDHLPVVADLAFQPE
ncbi:endonuclease/exonuclease/phosphatase family protein [Urbifossiella limnaea]|uniref:Endonuclease/Exonuclease/phosphatase family protein n=1 Tax=Urbifossiella limnaea TaxID=2528023 RepID=A0A517Y360_9BACT|nr:endonuclease/exonuclease/phosphatase family protein [Urbifossiella limnaea]QDU24177.1 Endonuclease/Exonuclease/phosphatase family protein [Urbifossiella limnaea]